jgi:hypothetical protein
MIKTVALCCACFAGLIGCTDGGTPNGNGRATADNGVALCGSPVVYLNFDGVTITKGANDDSRINVTEAPAIPDAGFEVPPFADATIRTKLTELIDRRLLLQRIPVVHSRPKTGNYFMLVFVDEFLQGVQGGRSTKNCGHANPNTIGFLNTAFYMIHGGLDYALAGSMLMLGYAAGLDPVDGAKAAHNCMDNSTFQSQCDFGQVPATLGDCSDGPQDQIEMLDALACK